MTAELFALCFDAADPADLARFWAGLLDREIAPGTGDGVVVGPGDGPGFRLRFQHRAEPKSRPNRMHFDLTSTSWADQERVVARALELGGRHIDLGLGPAERHVNLADPGGNEFDVIEPGNRFLAGCGFVGALACDGTRDVGLFWSAALGWPLVWDQDEETAIQSPAGGTKITWGGPPVAPKAGRNRVRFDLVPAAGADHRAETDRLVSLGAQPAGEDAGHTAMLDPDGNEFRLLAR